MITNENDFLGLLISCADENNDCKPSEVFEKSGMSDIDCLPFIKSLQAKELTKTMDTETIHIYPQAYQAYVSPVQKAGKSVVKASKFTFAKIVEIIVAVIGGLVIAYFIFRFGWN